MADLTPEIVDQVVAACRADADEATQSATLGPDKLPEGFTVNEFKAGWVDDLAGAVRLGQLGDGVAIVRLELSAGEEKSAVATLVWPLAEPPGVLGAAESEPEKAVDSEPAVESEPTAAAPAPPTPKPSPLGVGSAEALPNYIRSLLRVMVPVVVNLAEKRERIGKVLKLGPGSIIQFEKSCEAMLEMDVANRPVANGEAVKVGDKFGLRITSVILPEERFHAVRPG